MSRRFAPVLALFALVLLTGARDPILVPEISQHEVDLQQGFTGTDLLLFGAILTPEGSRAAQDYDIVIVLKGPTQSIVLREKQKVAGIWINAASTEFRSAPSYYAIASTRPISEIVDDKTAAIYELGLKWLQLSPIGAFDPAEQARFADGLVDLNRRHGLYREDEGGVTVSEQVLYQAHIGLPSSVPTGTYTAETFAISQGRVVASASSQVEVRKLGLERAVAHFSNDYGFAYGVLAVFISVAMGWLAGRLFALV
ncbi:TIGR02186 family protein [Novosphingobium mangrovi (ex Huang et al. 2023)]|uniref:TIGR02186 family protein n=1 Tax=Novosphingobium mangrovi (ex Huang et al. 2023) TaxID=2976432 RepID=A0ABT2I4I4_9SPHN|nr:TIGR02186 family protein [Novosphingobium mangrovi (ex Huang et al. 2023)]MCT2399709.1 TIGR02186 family protein [Novosphingobium mangrovi (ex Huang et al. 2023)]